MDWTIGKSESSIHPLHYSQTQPNDTKGMILYQVWEIEGEVDLSIHSSQSHKPVSEKDGVVTKHQAPTSMDSREGRLLSSKRVIVQNRLLPITNDFSDWNALNEYSVIPAVLKRWIHKSSTSSGIDCSSVRCFTTWLVEEGNLSPNKMSCSKPEASKGDEKGEGVLENWKRSVQEKQLPPSRIPLADNWGMSTSSNNQMTTFKYHRTDIHEVIILSLEGRKGRKIYESWTG